MSYMPISFLWRALKIIWADLSTGEDFRDRWYLWASQQGFHVLIGMILVLLSCLGYSLFEDELPYKLHLFLFIASLYAFWELVLQTQSTKGYWDSLEDFIFVVIYGAGSVITIFTEREAGVPLVTVDLTIAIPFLLTLTVHLFIGCSTRIWGQMTNGNGE